MKYRRTKKNIKQKKTTKLIKTKSKVNEKNIDMKIKELIDSKKIKDPELLRVGYITKKVNNNIYIVKKNKKGRKYYSLASEEDIKCKDLLKENMKKYISIYKITKGKGTFKSYNNAKSFALKQTRKTYPDCLLVNDKYSKNRESEPTINMILRNIKYYTRYTYYKIKNLLF